MLHSN